MSVVDSLKKMFPGKAAGLDAASDLADGDTLDAVADRAAGRPARPARTVDFSDSLLRNDEEVAADEGDWLVLPVLGRRTSAQHLRILAILLGTALLVLAVVTFFALSQADRAAQQVAATGQSLMQSQRLAKSVSQALVGNGPAFADVKESANVLARTVRGLKNGDDPLRLDAIGD